MGTEDFHEEQEAQTRADHQEASRSRRYVVIRQDNWQALGISEQTFHRWRNQYGGMKAEEAKRLKELEAENKRLKKLLAEAQLDKEILKEALEGNY